MLVLSRKVGERIQVGDDLVLEIRQIAGKRVTIAFDAPRTVRIVRGELEQAVWAPGAAEHMQGNHAEHAPEMVGLIDAAIS